MLTLASIFNKNIFLHLFDSSLSMESYLFLLIGTLVFLVLGYIFRVQQIKSNQRKLSFLVDKRTKLISKQKQEIEDQNQLIQIQKEKSDQLLLNVLPDYVVKELKQKDSVTIKTHENASVMFIDIVGFSNPRSVIECAYANPHTPWLCFCKRKNSRPANLAKFRFNSAPRVCFA